MTKPYHPSNGSDGMFVEETCAECRHDRAFQRGEGDSCPIIATLYAEGEAKEWVVDDDGWSSPRCTSFLYDNGTEVPYRCDKTIDMFERK